MPMRQDKEHNVREVPARYKKAAEAFPVGAAWR